MPRPTIWVVSEHYYPEESATGHYMTGIAEWLAKDHPVSVLCSRPKHASAKVRTLEKRGGVLIRRLRTLRMSKDILFFRLLNILTINLSFLLAGLIGIGRNDVVIVVTNPPSLPFVIIVACLLKKAKCVVRVDDVYPDALAAAGMLNPRSQAYKFISWLSRWLFTKADKIVAIGRDMDGLLRGRLGDHAKRLCVITNWADDQSIKPNLAKGRELLERIGLNEKFVIQCAGNIGRVQAVELIFEAALALRGRSDLHFLFIGAGAKKAWLENNIGRFKLTNVTILRNRPRAEQVEFLNACDVALSALKAGMLGVSVPSRSYNVFAAGKPIIAVADSSSELALIIKEERLGWVVAPGDVAGLTEAILEAKASSAGLSDMGERARKVAESRFAACQILPSYSKLVEDIRTS